MLKLVGRRLLALIPILLLVVLIATVLLDLGPGDAAQQRAGELASPEQVEAVRERLGLDQSFVSRYVSYLFDAAQGDLGRSLDTGQAVVDIILAALPITLSLALFAMVFAMLIGIPAGILSALRPNGWFDRGVNAVSAVALAVPPFVIAVLLVIPLALDRTWFPATGYVGPTEDTLEWIKHITLPGLALAIAPAAELCRQTRGAFVDILEADYIRTAHANGFSRASVVLRDAARNAAIPVVTVVGLQVGRVIGGAVVIEAVFGLPGFGSMAIAAVRSMDFPVIQGAVLVSALLYVSVNLLVDLSYGVFNPKVREQ